MINRNKHNWVTASYYLLIQKFNRERTEKKFMQTKSDQIHYKPLPNHANIMGNTGIINNIGMSEQ